MIKGKIEFTKQLETDKLKNTKKFIKFKVPGLESLSKLQKNEPFGNICKPQTMFIILSNISKENWCFGISFNFSITRDFKV